MTTVYTTYLHVNTHIKFTPKAQSNRTILGRDKVLNVSMCLYVCLSVCLFPCLSVCYLFVHIYLRMPRTWWTRLGKLLCTCLQWFFSSTYFPSEEASILIPTYVCRSGMPACLSACQKILSCVTELSSQMIELLALCNWCKCERERIEEEL